MTTLRHDLLFPGPEAWDAALRGRPDLAEMPLLADWVTHGWPVIVRRRMSGDRADDVPAGVPLPLSHGKRRVVLRFPARAAPTPLPPVLLRDAAPAAPAAWQPAIAALVDVGEVTRVAPRVFGALLWEHVTGLSYLTTKSDLDLLWDVPDEAAAAPIIDTLLRLDALGPVRLDGEFILPDGAGVNWRELAQASGPDAVVLAKTMDGVEARPRSALFCTPVPAR